MHYHRCVPPSVHRFVVSITLKPHGMHLSDKFVFHIFPLAPETNTFKSMLTKIRAHYGHLHSGKSAPIRESNHGSGVCKEHYA